MVTIAIEGLPGAGKSTVASAIASLRPEALIIPEILIDIGSSPTYSDFLVNDRKKGEIIANCSASLVVLDRYWPSTVAYVHAEERLLRSSTAPITATYQRLVSKPFPEPTLYVYLEDPRAVERTRARDGLWPRRDFRRLVCDSYREIFEFVKTPTIVLGRALSESAMVIAQHVLDALGTVGSPSE